MVHHGTKEKSELRDIILRSAREVFIENGYDRTSIRSIAERTGYSSTSIYLHFKDKKALLHALHLEGFAMLNERMKVLTAVQNPFERLKAMAHIYMQFAADHKGLYDLMFIQDAPIDVITEEDESWKEGMTAFGLLHYTVKECVQQGSMHFEDTEAASFLIWSTLHGMIALQHRNRCSNVITPEKRDTILQLGLEALMKLVTSD